MEELVVPCSWALAEGLVLIRCQWETCSRCLEWEADSTAMLSIVRKLSTELYHNSWSSTRLEMRRRQHLPRRSSHYPSAQ